MPHYPQDEGPLCCCEYLNRHGERAHVLGLCCACEEIDRAADDLVHGQVPSRDRIDEALLELDDRLRLPTPGGAVHLGVAGTLPWFILPWPLLFGAISARMLLVCAVALVPALAFWHRRVLRLRRRTGFLFWWQLASIAYECTAYTLLLALHQTRAETALFFIPLVTSMLLLFRMQCVDATSARGAADEAGANARAARCPVSGHLVPRYDHYCILCWSSNSGLLDAHRALLASQLFEPLLGQVPGPTDRSAPRITAHTLGSSPPCCSVCWSAVCSSGGRASGGALLCCTMPRRSRRRAPHTHWLSLSRWRCFSRIR